MKEVSSYVRNALGSRRIFWGIVIFFCIESLWVAFSAVYPMAFDEDFHFGIIKIYSHHWLPFLSSQPDGGAQFGALARDPSYLYHYLMSFPYRLVAACTDSQTAQVIMLRLLNVAMAATGVVLFRRVLLRAGSSPAITNVVLLLFVLVPIMPMLAGQINYDNAVLPLVAATCLLVFRIHDQLRERRIDVTALALLAIVCLLTSLIKYAFLPIGLAAAAFVLFDIWRAFRGRLGKVPRLLLAALRRLSRATQVGLLVALLGSSVLFVQRYGVNMVKYHTPVPECDAVLNETQCMAYGPWARNYELAEIKPSEGPNPLTYTWQWLLSLHYRLFFVVNGPADSYRNYPPLPLPSAAAVVIVISGCIALALYAKRIFAGRPLLAFLLLLVVLYCLVLWAEDYSQYLDTGEPVAINGRYLLPVLLPLAAVFGRAFSVAVGKHAPVKACIAGFALVLFLQGGGVLSFILRSDPNWYWPNSAVQHANNGARTVLAPVVIEGSKYY